MQPHEEEEAGREKERKRGGGAGVIKGIVIMEGRREQEYVTKVTMLCLFVSHLLLSPT